MWQRGPIISSAATGSGCIIQSDFNDNPSLPQGNFEAVVLVQPRGRTIKVE